MWLFCYIQSSNIWSFYAVKPESLIFYCVFCSIFLQITDCIRTVPLLSNFNSRISCAWSLRQSRAREPNLLIMWDTHLRCSRRRQAFYQSDNRGQVFCVTVMCALNLFYIVKNCRLLDKIVYAAYIMICEK